MQLIGLTNVFLNSSISLGITKLQCMINFICTVSEKRHKYTHIVKPLYIFAYRCTYMYVNVPENIVHVKNDSIYVHNLCVYQCLDLGQSRISLFDLVADCLLSSSLCWLLRSLLESHSDPTMSLPTEGSCQT